MKWGRRQNKRGIKHTHVYITCCLLLAFMCNLRMSRSLWQRLRIKVTRFWWRTSRVSATRLPTRRRRPSSRSATFWRTSERRVTTAAAVHCARRHATAAGCGRRSTSCDRAAVHVSITPYVTVVFLSHNCVEYTAKSMTYSTG